MQKNSIFTVVLTLLVAVSSSSVFAAQFKYEPIRTGPVKVGPPNGTVIAVGGGVMGPRIYKAIIDAAGGPNSLILVVPNNSIEKPESAVPAEMVTRTIARWRDHGARNVKVLFTQSRQVANSDAFTAIIKKARGIWFDGGRQYHDIRAYAGTKSEQAFWGVLERGGVISGSSAGMAVLGDFLVRGAPSHNNYIEDYPGSDKGFGFLRDTAADMHVVARERLPDLTSVIARYPKILGISADEGTAWVIKGDIAHIIGRDKAFAYNGHGTDPGMPYLTLYPGDVYDLYTRQVVSRVADRSPVKEPFISSLFEKYDKRASGGATVLVAEDGDVFVDRAFGIPPQNRYMPRTTLPQFPLGNISEVFTSLCSQLPPYKPSGESGAYFPSSLAKCIAQLSGPIGMHRTVVPPGNEEVLSDVDELYRLDLGLQFSSTWPGVDYSKGWMSNTFDGVKILAAYATPDGKQAAFVRIPSRKAAIIILTNDPNANARAMSVDILTQLLRSAP